jgi:hypothetical protein
MHRVVIDTDEATKTSATEPEVVWKAGSSWSGEKGITFGRLSRSKRRFKVPTLDPGTYSVVFGTPDVASKGKFDPKRKTEASVRVVSGTGVDIAQVC